MAWFGGKSHEILKRILNMRIVGWKEYVLRKLEVPAVSKSVPSGGVKNNVTCSILRLHFILIL